MAEEAARPELVHLDLERGWRGGERQLWWLIRGLDELGYRQTLICRQASPLVERLAGVPGLNVRAVAGRWGALRALPRRRAGLVVHAHTGNTIPLALWGGRGPARALITRRLDLRPTPWVMRAADHVVAISTAVRDVQLGVGVPLARITVIPSAIDRRRALDPAAVATRRARLDALGVPADATIALTIAALVDQKDPLTLVAALAELPANLHHVWVGAGPLAEAAAAAARAAGVADRLHLVGFDPEPDPWHGLADLFVLPSIHEGLGTALLDAFHFGVPVVTTQIPGTRDLIRPGQTALAVPPGDPAALAAAIRAALADPAAAEVRVAAAAALSADYDVAAMIAAYDALYRRL